MTGRAHDLGQQASAVEAARRIVMGGIKPPKPGSAEWSFLSIQLQLAADSLRQTAEKVDG